MKNLSTTEIFKPSLLSGLVKRACGVLSPNDRAGKRRWSAPAAGKLPAMRLETMEPRVLLSADLLVTAAAGANDLTVKYDSTTAMVQVINNVSHAVVIQDLASNVLSVKVQGSTGADRIVIDLTSGLTNQVIATDTASGDGDLIQVKGPNATWTLDGADAGHVGSALVFSGFENLLGDATGEDSFVLGALGSVSGSIDGGAGAGDALVIEARTVSTSRYQATGPFSGLLTMGGVNLNFAGLESITDELVVGDRVITATAGADHIRVKSGGSGKITVESDNGDFAGITFTTPTTRLTLQAGGGDDTISIGDDVLAALPGVAEFQGNAGTDTLVVASQRDVALDDATLSITTAGTGPTIDLASIDQAFVAGLTVSAADFTGPVLTSASAVAPGGSLQMDDGMALLARMLRSTDGSFSLASLLDDTLSPAELQTRLDALDSTVGNVTLDTTTVPGETRFVVHVVRNLSALFDLNLDGSADFGGALGLLAQALDLNGLAALDFEASLNLTFGMDGDGFFIAPNAASTPELTVTKITHDAGDVSATGRLGFLGVDLEQITMAFDADAGLAFKFNDTVLADGKIRLPELASSPAAAFTSSALTDALATDLTVTGVLSVAPGLGAALPIADTQVTFSWADLSSTPVVTLNPALDQGALDIANFLKLDPADLLSSLGQLKTALNELIGTLDVDLPFVAGGLDGLVNVLAFLNDGALSPLSASTLPAVQTVQQLTTALGLDLSALPSVLHYDAASGQISFDLSFSKTFSRNAGFELDFDLANGLADFSTSSTAAIGGTLSVSLTLGLDGQGALGGASPLDWLFLKDVNLNYTATATAADLDATARFGFVKIEVFDGTASADFAVDLDLLDPGTTPDGRIDLSEFKNALLVGGDLTNLVDIDIAGNVDLTLPVKVAFLGINGSTATADNTLLMHVDMLHPEDATVILPTALSDLGNFARLDAATLVGLLGQVTGYLDQLRKSDTFAAADIPLIGPVLDDILGLADAFRDGVLFDDADDGKDASTTLLADVNAALEASALGGKLYAEISGGKLRLIANDASVTSISVAAATALGFAGTETATGGVFKSLTGSVAIPNVVSGDVTLAIALNGAAAVNVLVSNTGNNTRLGNDRRKLVDGDNTATFATVEELVLKLTEVLGANGLLNYNAVDDTLTIALTLSDTFGQVDVPVDFDLPGLPEFLELQTQGKLRLLASGGLNLTAGIYLGDAPSGDQIALTDLLSGINGGISTDVALTATGATNLPGFKLSGNADFTVVLNGTAHNVSVTQASTDGNSFLLDVVSDVQAAIDAVSALQGKVTVGLTGTKLNFVAQSAATSLLITAAADSKAVTELGLGTSNTGNRDNFTLQLRDGTSYGVSLFGKTTLAEVKTAVESATGNKVLVSLNHRETGLKLTDTSTAVGDNKFKVLLANKNTAAIGLGILAADAGEGETADGVIEGSDLGGLSALDRFFLQGVSANVALSLSTPQLVNGTGAPTDTDADGATDDGITGTAKFGFVGIDVEGGGTLVANLGIALLDPGTTAADGRISVAELLAGLGAPASLIGTPTLTGGGTLALDVSMSPALPGLSLPDEARIEVKINSLGNPFASTPVAPDIEFVFPDFGELLNFGNVDLNFASIVDGLQSLTDFLGEFEAFGFLSEPLPLIDLSVNDLISVADRFAQAVEDAQANPAATIQLLEDKLKEAFGIPQASNLIDLVLYTDTFGTASPDDDLNILRINLELAAGFNESLALNLDLAEQFGLPMSLAGAANLNASGDITVQLDFGFNIEDPLDIYIFDSTGIAANILAEGNDVSFRAALGPAGIFVKEGSAHIDAFATLGFNENLFKTPAVTGDAEDRVLLQDLVADFDVDVDFGGSANATLPVYFPTESIHAGDITLTWTDLFDPDTLAIDVPSDLLTIDLSQFSLFDQLLLGVDGIDLFLEGLQDILDGEVAGVTLPLVGDKLAGAADVIGDFRSGFVEDFRQAIEDLANPGDAASGADPLSTILFNLLGPDGDGLGLLLDITGDGLVTVDDVQYDTNLDEPGVSFADSFIKWNFKLGGDLVDVGAGIGFDIGIPGLGLETEGDINLNIGWELALGFGINGTDGFYLDVSDQSELELNVDVTVPGASITGTLGFLQLTASDDTTDDDGLFTHLGATFGVNIKNGKDATDENLSFGELGKIALEVGIAAEAVVDLDMALSLSSDLVPNAATNFPSVVADFTLVWSLGDRGAGELVALSELDGSFLKNGLKYVGFDHVGLDLGTYFSDVIGPIVEKVQEVTEPIKPFLDFLTAEIPVISQLAGPTTMLDIAAMSGLLNPGLIKAIEIVDQVIDLVDSIDLGTGGPIVLYFDDLIPSLDLVGSREAVLAAEEAGTLGNLADLPFSMDAAALKSGLLGGKTPQQIAAGLASGLGKAGSNSATGGVNKMLPGGTLRDGFKIDILDDPSQIFGMLMGQPADLVSFTMAPLTVKANFSAFFSLLGPLGVSINADFAAQFGPFRFAYDTFGAAEFANGGFNNPLQLFDGLYIDDTDGNGNDVPELQFDIGLWAAAELNLGIARGGVGGGLFAAIDFDLHDPNDDGRVRIKELVTNFLNQAKYFEPVLAPLAIFDITGKLTAELFAFVKVDLGLFQLNERWNITDPITLLDFESNFTRVPTLATELGDGVLQLNMGKFASERVEGDLSDGSENFVVKQKDGDEVWVWSTLVDFNGNGLYDQAEAQSYEATSLILALGGEGDDVIDLSGVSANLAYELEGNSGDDLIKAGSGSGAARILGGVGNDELWGGAGGDTLFGEAGDDELHGGAGADWLLGDGRAKDTIVGDVINVSVKASDGADTLYGNAGDDLLLGFGGADVAEGGTGNDVLIGDAGTVTVSGRLAIKIENTDAGARGFNDLLSGGANDDTIYGGKGDDTLHGDDGADQLFGEQGFDLITGGAGADTMFGGDDNDTLQGNAGNDQIYGNAGADTIDGDDDDDWIYGGTGVDLIHGNAGADHLFGNSDPDKLYGDAGNDYLEGGQGNDLLLGDSGQDTLVAGYGSDTLDGEGDSDKYLITARGGVLTELTTAYDSGASGTDTLTFSGTPGDDTVLLRAMADAYFPLQSKLDGLVSKYFNSGEADKLGAILQAIQDAYGPHDLPLGMVSAITAAYQASGASVASIVAAVATHYKSELEVLGAATDTAFIALINDGGAKVERFNYRNLEGITVNTLAGKDYVVSDDVLAATTVNLGLDDDTVQVGQVFRSERTRDFGTDLITGITAEDVYSTTEITRGWLSNGVSVPTTINGGDGNDNFTVFRNVAVLNLNGGDGDDLFTVRAFALAGSTDSERARTDMKGDAGADTILYAVNAPVGIDGGDGFDTVRVVGTEFADDFVITDSGVFGAGLNISYVNIEKLVADGTEGDDRYFVLSTGLDVVTEIDGGLGSDSFFVGGNPSRSPIAVISNDLRGHSGVILHSVESSIEGSAWDSLPADGLSANVADNEESMVLVNESAGRSSVFEGMAYAGSAAGLAFDSYSIRLSRAPTATVRVNVVPSGMSPEDEAKGYADLVFLKPGTDANIAANWVAFADLPALEFTTSNWSTDQTVTFRAVNDSASEGKRFTFINHTLRNSSDPDYRDVQMRSVKVLMNDDDRDGVVVIPSGTGNTVLEDGFTDSFEVRLTKAPTANVSVDMSVLNGDISLSSTSLSFTTGNWATPQTVTVSGKSDTLVEGFHTDYIRFDVNSADQAQTIALSNLAIDGDFDLPGVQSIPVDKATTFVLLPNRPIEGTLSVSVGGVALAAERFDLRGNTLSFLSATGTPELRTGAVLVSYSYSEAGYDGTEVRDAVVDLYDEDTPMLIIEAINDGSLDLIEGSGTSDSYRVRLSRTPSAGETVTVTADAVLTRSTYGGTALFNEQVTVDGGSDLKLTFTSANWSDWKTITVAALDDANLDGNDTQVFAPELQTVNKIRGPLIIDGAAGEGSLTLPAPLMMPWELNKRPSVGAVSAFTTGSGGAGAEETMQVLKADLEAVVATLQINDAGITTIQDLIGKTLEMSEGAGTAVVIDASRPRDLFDRFWLITSVTEAGDGKITLGLKNPTQIDPGLLPEGSAPTDASRYTISSLSINFFADEREQVDYVFVYDHDSVGDDVGALTSSDGAVIGFSANAMTVELAALQRAAKLLGLTDINALAGRTLEITVGDGVGRSWTINGVQAGPSGEYRTLTLADASGSGTPTNRSEFRIDGSDRYGRIVGFGMGPNVLFNGRPQPGGITYGDIEVVEMGLGRGDDQVRVDYVPHSDDHATERSGDFHTLLMLDTGAGNDSVTVKLDQAQDGQLALSLGQGNDTVSGGASSAGLIVFGNEGQDSITTGSGADTVFGDTGRVDYVNGADAIVTRFGHSEARLLNNPPVDSAANTGGVATLTDADANFATSYGGLAGLMMQVIGADGHVQYRRIVSNTATTLTLDTPWDTVPDSTSAYRVSVYPEDQTDGLYRGARHIWSINELVGDNDTLTTGAGDDTAIGGAGDDTLDGGSGSNWLAGDDARFDYRVIAGTDGATELASILDPIAVGNDVLTGSAGNDLLLGGFGDDTLSGREGDDVLVGDASLITFGANNLIVRIETLFNDDERNGEDELRGESGSDVLIGGARDDRLDGGSEDDLLFGDNVVLTLNPGSGDAMATRYRTVAGALYGASGEALVGSAAQARPGGNAAWADWTITLDPSLASAHFGNDYLAGGAQDDTIFGQRGNDQIQGDGSIDETVSASRGTDGSLLLDASVEALADGDDYIEGNAGDDLIFGNLGQDDIVGGSSSAFVFSLKDVAQRDDGADTIFGGAGTDLARNGLGNNSHGRDADMILGDNGNIYRVVANSALRSFGYDNYANDTRIVVRAAGLADYTLGGPDYVPSSSDKGASDEIHGESGDDFLYGMTSSDLLFGEGQDDDLIGGWGHDWISGGSGDDGVLGDDGRLLTSRNGTAELLAGVVTATTQSTISTPGGVQSAVLNPSEQLRKTGDLTPFNVNPVSANVLADPQHADDVIFGGWGNDFLHGGSGDDAMSGAEALPTFYAAPANTGDALQYNAAKGEFARYDEYAPMTQLSGFLLNFDATEGPLDTYAQTGTRLATDGEDKLFGDLGNDWLVGGSGRDALYGGWGDDLLNVDDDQSTAGGLNNTPDTHTSYEDRAFGGAGRDVLIANTGGDRLIDWVGEFNSYIVPFAPFGNATISRTLQPQLAEFLYAVSKSDGADASLGNTSDPRNGEPLGELGVIRQADSVWQDQTGAPADPQAGNVPGGKRDVLRSADMNNGETQGLLADSGVWQVTGGALEVAASSPQADAVAVYHVGDALPSYFEVTASIQAMKPTAGWNANSYVVFDYQSQTNFKFAGIDVSTNKLVIGQRTQAGWQVLKQGAFTGNIKSDTWYNVVLSVNGLTATLIVDNSKAFSHTFTPTVVDGYSYGLNWGLVGFGSNKSRGAVDNIAVQVVPATAKVSRTEDFSTGMGPTLTAVANSSIGSWAVAGGLLAGSPPAGADAAFQLLNVSGVSKFKTDSLLEMSTVLRTSGRSGFVFDRYSDTDFKWVAVDTATKQVLIGHRTASAWVVDAVASNTSLSSSVDIKLGVTVKGSSVSVTVNGQAALGFVFNAVGVDGRFGLFTRVATARFDSVTVKTNDPGVPAALSSGVAGTGTDSATPASAEQVQALISEAVRLWAKTEDPLHLASLAAVQVSFDDLADGQLAQYKDGQLVLDRHADGYGWFIDATPGDDREFALVDGVLTAKAAAAAGRMDMLTAIAHELGHAMGLGHGAGMMAETLLPGQRVLPEAAEGDVTPPRHGASMADLASTAVTIDWARSGGGNRLPASNDATAGHAWRDRFVNHLGSSASQLHPNAALRFQLGERASARQA